MICNFGSVFKSLSIVTWIYSWGYHSHQREVRQSICPSLRFSFSEAWWNVYGQTGWSCMTVPYVSASSSQCIVLQCLWTDWVIVHDGTIRVCQQFTMHCTTMFPHPPKLKAWTMGCHWKVLVEVRVLIRVLVFTVFLFCFVYVYLFFFCYCLIL